MFLIAGTGNLALAVLVATRARRAPGSLPLALLFLSLSVWQVAEGLVRLAPEPAVWSYVVMTTSTLPPALLWFFAVSICGKARALRLASALVVAVTVAFALATGLGTVFAPLRAFKESVHWNLAYLVLLVPIVPASWALVERRRRGERDASFRRGLALVSAGIVGGLLMALAELTELLGSRMPFAGPIGSLVSAGLLATAVLRHRVLEARVPLARLLAIAGVAAGAVAIDLWLVGHLAGAGGAALGAAVVTVAALALYRLLFVDWLEVAGHKERLVQLGTLAASVAHEIRNPLASIKGAAQIVERDLAGQAGLDSAREYLGLVAREVDRLDGVVEELLAYARPRPPRLAPVDLNALAGDLVRVARTGLPAGVALAQALSEEPVEVQADPEQLQRALLNLVQNAADAVGGAGTVTVRTGVLEGRRPEVLVEVLDDGPGIAPEHLERVLDPFFTTKARGTGLGLAVAAAIAEAHGGRLAIENGSPRGARARLCLPRAGGAPREDHG